MPSSRPASRPALALLLRTLAAAAALAAFGLAIAGCGSSSTPGSDADPATVVPATAPLYVGATLRPTGALKSSALAAGAALAHTADPYARLVAALQTPGSPPLEFSRDVAPWLGTYGGVFATSLAAASPVLAELEQGLLGGGASAATFPFGSGAADGAIVLDTSDSAKAKSFLEAQAGHAGAHATSYRGVAYQATGGGLAFGLVDRLAVIGSEAAFHGVVDTSLGGAPLVHASEYATLLAKEPEDTLAHAYVSSAAAKAPGAAQGLAGAMKLLTGGRTANVSLTPTATSLSIDADTLTASSPSSTGGLLSPNQQAVHGLEQLPGESWLAIGLGNLSTTLSSDVKELESLLSLTGASTAGAGAGGGFGLQSLLAGLTTPLRVLGADTPQAKQDYASWMGPGGVFASGSGLLELKAGVSIDSTSPARSREAVAKLGAALRASGISVQTVNLPGTEAAIAVRLSGVPLVVNIAAARASDGQPKFVLALGEASLTAALDPPSTLSTAASYSSAQSTLGQGSQPSLIVDVPTALGLLESVGLLSEPTVAKLLPYLRGLTTVVGGGLELDPEIERYRIVLGLTPAGG